MRWLLVSTNDDVRLVKQDHFCHRCFEKKTRTTILMDLPIRDGDPERLAWLALARERCVRMYGAVACACYHTEATPTSGASGRSATGTSGSSAGRPTAGAAAPGSAGPGGSRGSA